MFLLSAPLLGWRHVEMTERRTRRDFASVLRGLVDVHFPEAEEVMLVTDNLNTHSPASLYEAFEPSKAKRIADRIEWHYTPRHGSWLNMAEIELSVLAGQCLAERMGSRGVVAAQVAAWEARRNADGVRTD